MIMLPLMTYQLYIGNSLGVTFLLFIVNIFLHAQTDDMKVNVKQINLIQDQVIHLVQIVVSWFLVLMV